VKYAEALQKMQAGQYFEAVKEFSAAMAAGNLAEEVYFNRGVCHLKNGYWQEAIEDFSESTRLNPMRASAYYQRALARMQRGEWQAALMDLNRYVILEPKDARAYYQRGLVQMECDNLRRAVEDLVKSLSYLGDHAEAYLALAEAYLRTDKRRQAAMNFLQAAKLFAARGMEAEAATARRKAEMLARPTRRPGKRYINVLERLVAREYDRQILDLPPATLATLERTDVEAWVLNRLPHHLYATSREWAAKLEEKLMREHGTLIRETVQQGIIAVHANYQPPREAELPEADAV